MSLRPIPGNLAWLLFGELVVKGGVLVMIAVVSRGMGAASLGVFTVALGAVLVATPLLALGQVEVLIREIAHTPRRSAALVSAALAVQRRAFVWVALPVAAGILWVPDPLLRLTLIALAPYVWLRVETLTRGAAFKGLDRMDVEARARAVEVGVAAPLVASAALLGAPVWVAAAGLSLGGGAGLAWLARKTRALPDGADTVPEVNHLLRRGLPFLGLGAGFQLLVRSDTFALEALSIPNAVIGHYGAAAALTWGGLAAAQLVAVALFPTVSRRAAEGASAGRTAFGTAAIGFGIGLVVATGMALLRQPLLELVFGAAVAGPAEPLLLRMVWVLPAASATMILGVVLAAWHRQTRQLAALVGMLVIALALEVLLIRLDGPAGAALAVVIVHGLAALAYLALAAWPERRGPGGFQDVE